MDLSRAACTVLNPSPSTPLRFIRSNKRKTPRITSNTMVISIRYSLSILFTLRSRSFKFSRIGVLSKSPLPSSFYTNRLFLSIAHSTTICTGVTSAAKNTTNVVSQDDLTSSKYRPPMSTDWNNGMTHLS